MEEQQGGGSKQRVKALLDKDYSQIDKSLMGSSVMSKKHVHKSSEIAPPQGNLFLDWAEDLGQLLKKLNNFYK